LFGLLASVELNFPETSVAPASADTHGIGFDV
jgi:hypothetical protein